MDSAQSPTESHYITHEPYYEPVGNEVTLFEAAYANRLPVLLKGPTGCGKTRFMEYMAWRLKRPLITVSCHDDLTTSDLVGRYLVKGGETTWVDGPLTRAVRAGGICYLDEIVEARKDTMVVIHPLADDRRMMPIEKLGQLLEAPAEFCGETSGWACSSEGRCAITSPDAPAKARRRAPGDGLGLLNGNRYDVEAWAASAGGWPGGWPGTTRPPAGSAGPGGWDAARGGRSPSVARSSPCAATR